MVHSTVQRPADRSQRIGDDHLYDEARDKAERAVIEAEPYKATIAGPQGTSVQDNEFYDGELKADDEFFHITCHVDPTIVSKISKGEFIDLEKLIPKPKGGLAYSDQKMELVFREGKPVFLPHVDKSHLISGFRKWEQAFRVCAAIYGQANSHRSAEIWQYVFQLVQQQAHMFGQIWLSMTTLSDR